jgi:hypothetical protein
MNPLVLAATLAVWAPADPVPVAVVLSTTGPVTLQDDAGPPRRASAMDPLRPGDRLTAPADGGAQMVSLADGTRVRLKSGAAVTVSISGYRPADAVEPLRPVTPAVAANLQGPRSPTRGGRLGTDSSGPFGPMRAQGGMRPSAGTRVLSVTPTLAWEPAPAAVAYRVSLFGNNGRALWTVKTTEPRLPYPEGQPPLRRGWDYTWRVTARTAEGPDRLLVSNVFSVASDSVAAEMAGLAPLAAGSDPADVLLVAASCQAHGLEDEALTLYERLTELAPAEPAFHAIRAEYYQRAGRLVDARAERARAAERAAAPGGEAAASPPAGAGPRR